MGILRQELIKKAIGLSEPSIIAILGEKGMTWGPRWIVGYISGPGLFGETPILFQVGEDGKRVNWREDWGNRDEFFGIAYKKIGLVMREKCPSSVIIATKPWLLQGGEFLYAGGFYQDGIGVSASGAKGRTDEACARIIHTSICLLAFLETENRIGGSNMEI